MTKIPRWIIRYALYAMRLSVLSVLAPCSLPLALFRFPSRTVVPYFPYPPRPCPFPFPLALSRLTPYGFDHYFDLLGIFCYDAVISGFPL